MLGTTLETQAVHLLVDTSLEAQDLCLLLDPTLDQSMYVGRNF